VSRRGEEIEQGETHHQRSRTGEEAQRCISCEPRFVTLCARSIRDAGSSGWTAVQLLVVSSVALILLAMVLVDNPGTLKSYFGGRETPYHVIGNRDHRSSTNLERGPYFCVAVSKFEADIRSNVFFALHFMRNCNCLQRRSTRRKYDREPHRYNT